jgi:ribosomal protein S18 acetylase RimI-like enzyme
MDKISIREFKTSDYGSLALIHDSHFPDHPYFSKRIEYEDSCCGRTRYQMKRFVAEITSGKIVGFGEYKHLFFKYHPRKFALNIEVMPQWRKRGIGGMLYDRIHEELAGAGGENMWPLVLSTQEPAIRFLRKRGFVEKRKMIESKLDLESFESTEYVRLTKKLEGEGIVISSLSSELQRDPQAAKKLKDLEDSGAADVPGSVADSPMSFHDYEVVILNNPIMVWDGSFVAKEEEVYVGESSLLESGVGGVIDQGFTVVRPGYRGRGIAQAVKLQTVTYARNKGAKYVRTHNDSENHPMLAVNKKMGFVKQAEWITFEKELQPLKR